MLKAGHEDLLALLAQLKVRRTSSEDEVEDLWESEITLIENLILGYALPQANEVARELFPNGIHELTLNRPNYLSYRVGQDGNFIFEVMVSDDEAADINEATKFDSDNGIHFERVDYAKVVRWGLTKERGETIDKSWFCVTLMVPGTLLSEARKDYVNQVLRERSQAA